MTPVIRAYLRAAAEGDANLVRGLLAQGAYVDSVNHAGQTALMLAAGFNRREVVSLLLAAGANTELQDDLGLTAVDWAENFIAIAELIESATKPVEAVAQPPARIQEVSPPVTRPIIQPTEKPARLQTEEPALKGLAGAILRDHKTKVGEPQPINSIPESLEPESLEPESLEPESLEPKSLEPKSLEPKSLEPKSLEPKSLEPKSLEPKSLEPKSLEPKSLEPKSLEPKSLEPKSLEPKSLEPKSLEPKSLEPKSLEPEFLPADDTLDKPLSQVEDTAASARPVSSRSRIFDLDSTNDTPRPVSKVEVSVPSFDRNNSKSRTFLWVLLLITFAAVGFVTYRFGRSLFSTPITNNESPSSSPTPRTQSPQPDVKKLPIVSGDLAGAELHLADVEYPADQAKGQSGTVNVQVQVSQKGIVLAAKTIDGDEVFRAAAEKAAKSSAFAPYKLVNKSSVIEGTITYTFVPGQRSDSKSVAEHGVTASAGGPLAGTELKLVKPDYSSNGDQEDAARTLTVVVRVTRSGRVVSWRFLDGDQRLHGAVLNAVRRSTFDPAKLNGTGDVVGTITYTFN